MIFKICGFIKTDDKDGIDVVSLPEGLSISLPDEKGIRRSILIQPKLVNVLPDICSGYIGRDLGIQLVWDSERFNTRDAVSSVSDRKSIADISDSKFVISFTEQGCNVVICSGLNKAPSGDNVEFVELPHSNTPRTWLASQDDVIAKFVKRNRAKRSAVGKIKTLDSIAELEKQVDLLSQLVFCLIGELPIPYWAQELIAAVQNNTSVTDPSKAINDVSSQKQAIRTIQKAYFSERE